MWMVDRARFDQVDDAPIGIVAGCHQLETVPGRGGGTPYEASSRSTAPSASIPVRVVEVW